MSDLVIAASERPRGAEWLCVRECLRFSLRHRRYLGIFALLYWHSLRHWSQARAARYGYCFLQVFDDIMDGDRSTIVSPDVVAEQTIAAWASGRFGDDGALSRLGAAFHAALGSLTTRPGDDPHSDVTALLRLMRADARRRSDRSTLDAAALEEHLRATFYHSLNLLLMAAGTRTRADDVPDLVRAMAWCSVVRDFDEDLAAGLMNVPVEVVAIAGEVGAEDPVIRDWLGAERLVASECLERSAVVLVNLSAVDRKAAGLLGLFQRSVQRYVA